jgi:sugar lactone lactonase YvrE
MRRIVFLLLVLIVPVVGKGQIITTFAGGGSGLGDGGPATAAYVTNDIGGAFDNYGNYYCAEPVYYRIRKVSNAGIITTVAGNGLAGSGGDNGPATAAELSLPSAVRIDAEGNLYICDNGSSSIQKVDAVTGIITTVAGDNLPGFGGDGGPATSALLFDPQDICFDKSGNLYIADGFNQRIRKIDTSGIITTFAGTGDIGSTGDNGPATAAELNWPEGLATDDSGNLYIGGEDYLVRKVSPTGIITTIAGTKGTDVFDGDGVPATNAKFRPFRLTIDPSGELVISDISNNRVFHIDAAGIIHTIAGNGIAGFSGDNGAATAAEIDNPAGVVFDSCGNLFIAAMDRVRKISYNPACWPEKVDNITPQNLSIYPNPAYDLLHIDNIKTQSTYYLINTIGSTLQQGTLQAGSNNIPVQSLPPGVYILEISGDGVRDVVRVVKE